LDAVDSASLPLNTLGDLEPPDQGLCAGGGYVVETNNIGEILIFNSALDRVSSPIADDAIMGLPSHGTAGWSSGGDPSCLYDSSNGGHWIITEIVSKNSYASGGPFSGCFAGLADGCAEGIAVTQGRSPFGPYNVYFLNPDYNSNEPGYPSLLNDFAKISVTRDAFLLFYDEFPLTGAGLGFGFNGAQEFAFTKSALENGEGVTLPNGKPDPHFNVAIENMGLLPNTGLPDGTCATTGACWYQVIPAEPPDPSQYDNANGGSGFMLGSLDFFGTGDTRIAAFDWTGLSALNSSFCHECSAVQFGGQLLSGVEFYYGEGQLAAQKAGPIPLGDDCVAAGAGATPPFTVDNNTLTSCPEGGIATNGDGFTQVSQAQGQLWGAVTTEVAQSFSGETTPEVHQGAAYWVVGTNSFDYTGAFSLTSEGYVSAAHEDIEFPAMAATGNWFQDGGNNGAIMTFTLSGNGGPTGADGGGFYPSTAYGRLTSTSGDLVNSTIHVADPGQSPQDGFTEYSTTPSYRPRWGDYSWAVYAPWSGRIYFATNYIPYPNCSDSVFTVTIGTCGGTRDGLANWGTSVNYVTP
jgi:hypothetical protein